MSKVYVIIERCNALQYNYFSYKETVGVAESHAAAESMIEKMKDRIIADAAANGWIVTGFMSPADGIAKVTVDYGDMCRDKREYTWRIEEHELIKES